MKDSKNIKRLKRAMLYIQHWAEENGVSYFSFGHHLKPEFTIISLTYTEEGKEDDYKFVDIDLESKGAKAILKEFKGLGL